MDNDHSFEWLAQQLGQVLKRIEKCEGKIAQLQASSIQPGWLSINRREFQQMEERVKKLEGGQ
jgi:hypothetical protein